MVKLNLNNLFRGDSGDDVIIECQYFPPIAIFAFFHHKKVVIEACETYQKRSFRNKCLVAGAHGVQRLTVPLKKGKHEAQSITEVRIAYDEPWQLQHINTIKSAYGSAAFFAEYIDAIGELIFQREQHLFPYNLKIIRGICKLLDLSPFAKISSDYLPGTTYDFDLRNQLTPRSYELKMRSYPQVFSDRYPFQSNLSILDLIFCLGPYCKSWISGIAE